MMHLLLALLLFAHPKPHNAAPGLTQPEGQFVVSPEGVFRIEKGVVMKPPKKFHPAFVFSSEDRFKVGIKPAEHDGVSIISADDKTLQIRYSDGFVVRRGSGTALTPNHEIESAHSIIVNPSSDEYLLIRWEGSCAFSLFKTDADAIKEVATNTYTCSN